MTYAIIGFTVLISLYALRDSKVFNSMVFEPFVINVRKDWFRIVTHGFIHGSGQHLAVNMFVLWMFGPMVEHGFAEITGRSGQLPFLMLYLAGITLSSIPGYMKHRWDPTYRAVGASGATSAVVFSSMLMFPLQRMLFPPGPAWFAGLLYLGYEYYLSKRGNDGIAHDAHFAGALVGILFTVILDPPILQRFVVAVSSSFT